MVQRRSLSISDGGSAASRASSAASSVAALLLKGKPSQAFVPSCPPTVKVTVEGNFDAAVSVNVVGCKAEGSGLPDVCPAGKATTATFLSTTTIRGSMSKGTLTIEDFEPIPFSVAHNDQGSTFVHAKGRWRYTALWAPKWNWKEHEEKPTDGKAADLEVVASRYADKPASLKVHLRLATESELKRCLQNQALREAQVDGDYDMLFAQVSKAKQAGVPRENIEIAEERLRELRKQGLHVNEGCDKETLGSLMKWDKISRFSGRGDNEPCKACPDCPCNEEVNCGEVLEVKPNAVQNCLKDFGPEGDRELFEELSGSALSVEEGSVWKAGGKFIFSAFDRNQSVSALTRMLHSSGRARAAKMILAMAKCSEAEYGGYVTAIQVNFHPHGGTYHAQHRDIYSAKQRAGPSCTCSFRKCVGTVCYTVGSSRVCLLETMTDEFSAIKPCSPSCTGRRDRRWLHSGDAMYFNEAWNANHTHGIPVMDYGEDYGPRISVAFLLGAEDFRVNMHQIGKPMQMPLTLPAPALPGEVTEEKCEEVD